MAEVSDSALSSLAIGQADLKIGGFRDAESYADQLAELYESDFVEPPLKGTPHYRKEQFLKRLFEWYVTSPHFKIVTLWKDDKLAGFIYGCSLPPKAEWWSNVKGPLPEGFTDEDGNRTLAVLDILVRKDLRGQRLASHLHGQLIQGRSEERITLLSEPQLQPAYSIWQHWGYRKISTTNVEGNETPLDVFIRQLD